MNTNKSEGLLSNIQIIEFREDEINSIKKMYVQTCINLISNAISKTEFKTYENDKPIKNDSYFAFNVSPNKNQNASDFWKNVAEKLVFENDCLVIQKDNQFFIADSFTIEEDGIKELLFKDVTIKNKVISKSIKRSEVFYFTFHDKGIKKVIDEYYEIFGRSLFFAMKGYERSKATRAITRIDANTKQGTDTLKALASFTKKLTDVFQSKKLEDYSVMPITKGFDYEEIQSKYKSDGASDITELTTSLVSTIAGAFQIPVGLIKGDVVDLSQQMIMFINLCISPLAEMIADEINKIYYKKEGYQKGNFCMADFTKVIHLGMHDKAITLEKLITSGVITRNEAREDVNLHKAGEELDEYLITKNYEKEQ